MSCTACQRDIQIVAKGLCRACYERYRKRGTTEYAEKRAKTLCQIDNCGKPVVSHGMCDTHRKRFERHGHVEQTRPDDWGSKKMGGNKKPHPLYHSWAYLRRHRGQHAVCESWRNDFLQFVADLGERPSPKHKLYAADESLPLGPGNYVWKRSITEKAVGEDAKTYNARAQRVYRKVREEAFHGYNLKKLYGLSRKEYELMLDEQNGCCAICAREEGSKIDGKAIRLAVDHCHTNGNVRALLCAACNRGLGFFRDDPEIIRAAAQYLEKHALPKPPE